MLKKNQALHTFNLKCFSLFLALNFYFASGMAMDNQEPRQGGAKFVEGPTTFSATFKAGPEGGSYSVTPPNSGLENIEVNIPPNALRQETEITIGLNSGTFFPRKGEPSGYIIFLHTVDELQFLNPVTISVTTQKPNYKGNPIGFSIDMGNKISLIDSISNRDNNLITFYTFRPLLFTWVYP